MQQFLNFLPLPQGQGSLRPTRCCGCGSARSCWSACGAVDRRLLLLGDLAGRRALLRESPRSRPTCEPTKPSSSCSMRKIRSVTRSPTDAPHQLESPHALALVLDLGIDLGIAAQARRWTAGGPSPAGGLSRPCRESAAPAPAPSAAFRGGSDLRPPFPAGARAARGRAGPASSAGSSHCRLCRSQSESDVKRAVAAAGHRGRFAGRRRR